MRLVMTIETPAGLTLSADQLAYAAEWLDCAPTLEAILALIEIDLIRAGGQFDYALSFVDGTSHVAFGASPQAALDAFVDGIEVAVLDRGRDPVAEVLGNAKDKIHGDAPHAAQRLHHIVPEGGDVATVSCRTIEDGGRLMR